MLIILYYELPVNKSQIQFSVVFISGCTCTKSRDGYYVHLTLFTCQGLCGSIFCVNYNHYITVLV